MTIALDTYREQAFDIGLEKNRVRIPTNGADTMNVQAESFAGWNSGVLTIYRSLDGYTPDNLESAQTLSSTKITTTIETATFGWLIVEVSTKASAAPTLINLTATRSRSIR